MRAAPVFACLAALAIQGCGAGDARPSDVAARGPRPVVPATSKASAGPSTTIDQAPPPADPMPVFATVLDKAIAKNDGPDAVWLAHLALADGLLVVVNMPARAFLVRGADVTPLPDFFKGLRSPAPDWPPEEFAVSSLSGTLDDLRFTISAPGSEFADDVRGKPGKWRTGSGKQKGALAKQPRWVDVTTISEPLTTQKGARIYEAAPAYLAPATEGFVFRFDGPAKGETLPVPAPGKNGCRYAMLGHSQLTQNADGSIMGLGTICTFGDQPISTAKLNGVAPPFQSIGPRLGEGQLAVEHWVEGKSTILLLPGAERVAQFADFDFVRGPGGALWVVSQIAGSKGSEAYVASFEGGVFRNITPPSPPEHFTTFVSSAGELYLLHQEKSFRRRGTDWEKLVLEATADCGKEWMSEAFETPAGDLLLNGVAGCAWFLKKGGSAAPLLRFEKGTMLRGAFAHLGELYVLLHGEGGEILARLEPR